MNVQHYVCSVISRRRTGGGGVYAEHYDPSVSCSDHEAKCQVFHICTADGLGEFLHMCLVSQL